MRTKINLHSLHKKLNFNQYDLSCGCVWHMQSKFRHYLKYKYFFKMGVHSLFLLLIDNCQNYFFGLVSIPFSVLLGKDKWKGLSNVFAQFILIYLKNLFIPKPVRHNFKMLSIIHVWILPSIIPFRIHIYSK